MCNGNYLQAWQAKCIDELSSLDFIEPVLVIVNEQPTAAKQTFLKKILHYPYSILFYRIQKRFVKIPGQKTVDLPPQFKDIETIECRIIKKGKHSEYFSTDDIDKINSYNLDFIIRFGFNIIRGEILTAAKFGIWSYHHGDEQKYRGGPPCFWEIYRKEKTTGAILQKLTDKLDGGIILKKGEFGTVLHSHKDTINTVYDLSSYWIKQVCVDLQNNHANYLNGEPSSTKANIYSFPKNGKMMIYWFKKIGRKINFHMTDLFKPETWKVGVFKNDSANEIPLGSSQKITWYENPLKRGYYADPFIAEQNSEHFLLVENYDYKTEKANITCINLATNDTKVLIEENFHLSYPFCFTFENKNYIIPESSASNKICAYEVDLAKATVISKIILLEDIQAFDPTLFYHESKWWLFVSQKNTHSNTCLNIYIADSPLGPYTPHSMNPVKTNICSSRPAGGIFKLQDKFFRPSQNCSNTYGGSVVLNKINVLSETHYEETYYDEILPLKNTSHNEGLHTINNTNGLVTIDVKKHSFNRAHFFRQLARKLRIKS